MSDLKKKLRDAYESGNVQEAETILEKIIRLLRRAMLGTDDPQLNNDIAKELSDDE